MITFHLGWPQWIYIVLMVIGLFVSIERHGRPREGTYNGVASIISAALGIALLYWGGFFS
jgi:uncharacterized membrane protein